MYIEFVRYLKRVTRAMYIAWSLVGIKALKSFYFCSAENWLQNIILY